MLKFTLSLATQPFYNRLAKLEAKWNLFASQEISILSKWIMRLSTETMLNNSKT